VFSVTFLVNFVLRETAALGKSTVVLVQFS